MKSTKILILSLLMLFSLTLSAQQKTATSDPIDYYTNLGLLKPARLDNNYRYYSRESLIRLNLIEEMKRKRMTLEEIKDSLDLIEDRSIKDTGAEEVIEHNSSIGFLTERFSQVVGLLFLLQPLMLNMENVDAGEASAVTREFISESLSLIHDLVALIHELGHIL